MNRISHPIEIRPYLRDHSIDGKIVFPAVEIMNVLARIVLHQHPRSSLHIMASAQFGKALVLDPEAPAQEAYIETALSEAGIFASLLTPAVSKGGTVKRMLEHASLTFVQKSEMPAPSAAFRAVRKLDDGCINIPAVSIYRELVPFGAAYRNITGDLSLSEAGAIAEIFGGRREADDTPLGSPFVLDAAMHAACVWGQRFCGVVAFPVGFDRRVIHKPTRQGASYIARITPVDVRREPLIFHVRIFDAGGAIYEEIAGLRMRDITGGRMKPPEWIKGEACRKSF